MLTRNSLYDEICQEIDDKAWDYNNLTLIHGNLSHIWKMIISLTAFKIIEKINSKCDADFKIKLENFLCAIGMDKTNKLVTKHCYIVMLIYLNRLSKKINFTETNIFKNIALCFHAAFEYINDTNDYSYKSIIRKFMHLTKNEFKKALNEFYDLLDFDVYVDPQNLEYRDLIQQFYKGLYYTALKDLSLVIQVNKNHEKTKLLKIIYETICIKKYDSMGKILIGKLLEYVLHFRDNTIEPLESLINILGEKDSKLTFITTKYFLNVTKEYQSELALFKLKIKALALSYYTLDTQGEYFYKNLPDEQLISEKYDLAPFISLCDHYLEKNYNSTYYDLLKKISDEYPLLTEQIIPTALKSKIIEFQMETTFIDRIHKIFSFTNRKLSFFNAAKDISCGKEDHLQLLHFYRLTQDPGIPGKTDKRYNFYIEKFKTKFPDLIKRGIEYHQKIEKRSTSVGL